MNTEATPPTIYLDADACPVKDLVFRTAARYGVPLKVVANLPMRIPADAEKVAKSVVVPGHGKLADRAEAQRRLDADRRYLEALVPTVNSAAAGEGTEELARRILTELGEGRAQSELAWSMHLSNVEQLMQER